MKVMVTGGTGYVGAFSIQALVAAGHRVRLLVRDPAKAKAMLAAMHVERAETVAGDMTDEAAVLEAMKGCDAVLHCAAVVTTDPRRAEDMLQANPRGAQLVIGHAVRRGLDPVIHVSSVAALLTPGLEMLHADLPLGTLDSGYARSKALAEEYVRELQAKGAPVAITYPGSVTGPAAGTVLGEATQGLVTNVRAGFLPSPDASWSLIDARDLGRIHAALMEPGQGPRRIMCGGHYLRMPEMSSALKELTGREFKVLPLPGAVLRGIGRAADLLTRVIPADNPLTHEAMVCFTQMPPTDDSAVKRELGVRYRSVKTTMRESLLAARRAGLLEDEHIGTLARKRAR